MQSKIKSYNQYRAQNIVYSYLSVGWLTFCHRTTVIPGPRGLPFVGSMSLMSNALAHHCIAATAEKFGAKRGRGNGFIERVVKKID